MYRDLPDHVYDLTVEDAHSFVANGFVVHNTAAAVKDEFGEGRWTLEAGRPGAGGQRSGSHR